MKKAKDYAREYNANPDNIEAIAKVLIGMFADSGELIKVRHVSTNGGLQAIIKEQDNKWRAFVRLSGDVSIKPDGFLLFVIHRMPELHYLFPNVVMPISMK